jgi:Zn/Cd-binding protein ZinT
MASILAIESVTLARHHSHGTSARTEAGAEGEQGFADQDVKDRALSDWEGIWQSVNPYLLNAI